MTKYRLVLIEWEDSYGVSPTWSCVEDHYDVSKPLVVYSVGWLVTENDQRLVIVPHINDYKGDVDGCGHMMIPKSAIRKLEILREKEG